MEDDIMPSATQDNPTDPDELELTQEELNTDGNSQEDRRRQYGQQEGREVDSSSRPSTDGDDSDDEDDREP